MAWDETWREEVSTVHFAEPWLTGSLVRDRLVKAHPDRDPWEEDPWQIPPLRTINLWLKDIRIRDQDLWSLASAGDPRDGRVILATLREVIKHSRGGIRSITKTEADFLVRIHAARPDLEADLWTAYVFARLYAARQRHGESYSSLDLQLATEGDDVAQRLALGSRRPLAAIVSGISRATGSLRVAKGDGNGS